MSIEVYRRDGALYEDGYDDDGEPIVRRGTPYYEVVETTRLGQCDYELGQFETEAAAKDFAKAQRFERSQCGGAFCRCEELGLA